MPLPSTVTANVTAKAKRIVLGGKSYLVAPATIIVPGVLPGSKGPLLYEPKDIEVSTKKWDGVPLTAMHPYHPLTNEHLSAQDDGVWDRQGIGFIRDTSYNGKLKTNTYFDEERTRRIDPITYSALLRGQPIELSTGLYTSNEEAPIGSRDSRGRPYTHIARSFQPDHLAVLQGQKGACSLSDGCGVLVNRRGELVRNSQRELVVNCAVDWSMIHNTQCTGGKSVPPNGMKGTTFDPKVKELKDKATYLSERASVATRDAAAGNAETQEEAYKAHKDAKAAHVEAVKIGKKYDYSMEMEHLAKANYHDLKMREFGIKAGKKISPISNESSKFYRPENYDKLRDIGKGLEVWVGGNDWETGTTWAGIHTKDDVSKKYNTDRGREPIKWINIDHSDCPGCHGKLDAVGRKNNTLCREFGNSKVEEWLKSDDISSFLSESNDMGKVTANATVLIANSLPPAAYFQEGEGWKKVFVDNAEKYVLTLNPFVSAEQRKACYAQNDPNWDCEQWEKETKRVRNSKSLAEDAKGKKVKTKFEDASKELTEKDAPAELVGRQTTPDGRNIAAVRPTSGVIAGQGDEDSHDPGVVFDKNVKADKKVTGYSVPVSVSNAATCPHCDGEVTDGKCIDCGYEVEEETEEETEEVEEPVEDQSTEDTELEDSEEQEEMEEEPTEEVEEDYEEEIEEEEEVPVENEEQPRHPIKKTFQGKVTKAAKKGHETNKTDTKSPKTETITEDEEMAAAVATKKTTNNNKVQSLDEYKEALIANCSCEEERNAVRRAIMNTASEMGSGSKTIQAGGEEDSDDHEYESEGGKLIKDSMKVGGKKFIGKKAVANSMTELVQNYGTPQEQEAWRNAMQINAEVRRNLITRLVANVQDQGKKSELVKNFKTKSIDELRDLLLIQGSNGPAIQNNLNFTGANAPALNSMTGEDDNDALELPVMNWKSEE